MEFPSNDDSEGEEEVTSWRTLDTLPPEIILHICSFLSAKFVITVFSQVCKTFKDLVDCDTTWKMRIFRRWPKRYPLVPPVEDIDWKAACIAREEQHRLWTDPLENMRKFHFYGAHFGSVNVVQLIEQGKICLSGGRDGFIKSWNLDPEYLADQPFNSENINLSSCLMNSSQHSNAWIWDITYDSDNKCVYTGGFDCTIKAWNLDNFTESVKLIDMPSPILCLEYRENQLTAGCFGRTVTIFDTRTDEPILKHITHKKPVLCVATDDKYIISGSEDKSIIIYDKAARKVLKKIEFECFPLSMSYGEGQILAGDVNNFVHVIDPRHGEFELIHTFASGHSKKVTGIQHSLGSVITCSTDKTIRILEPNFEPEPIAVIESTHEVSRISLCNNILACANVDDSISVWVPGDIFN